MTETQPNWKDWRVDVDRYLAQGRWIEAWAESHNLDKRFKVCPIWGWLELKLYGLTMEQYVAEVKAVVLLMGRATDKEFTQPSYGVEAPTMFVEWSLADEPNAHRHAALRVTNGSPKCPTDLDRPYVPDVLGRRAALSPVCIRALQDLGNIEPQMIDVTA